MATVIQLAPSDRFPCEPESVTFMGKTVWAIVENARVRWVSVRSIMDVFPGIERQNDWNKLARKQQTLKCSHNGKITYREFISKDDYLQAASSHPDGEKLREFMAAVCGELDDKGVVFNPQYQSHPLVQAAAMFGQTAIRVAELEARVDGHDVAISRVTKQTHQNTNHIEELIDSRIRSDGRMSAVDGLRRRGWLIGGILSAKEAGDQLSGIAKMLPDRPPQEPKGAYQVLMHLPETFNGWEREYGPRYAKLHSRERDKFPPDRHSLAWLKKSDKDQGQLFV